MWVKPTRFSNYVASHVVSVTRCRSLIDSGDRRCTASASTPSSALKNYAISCRNFGLLGNWTARHIVENVKVEKLTDCAQPVSGYALRTSGRVCVGRGNSGHKPVPAVFEEGLRIKESLRHVVNAPQPPATTVNNVSDPGVTIAPPTQLRWQFS